MTAPRHSRGLPVVIAGTALTSAAALFIGVVAASLFAGRAGEAVIVLLGATAVAGVVGGFVSAPFLGSEPAVSSGHAETETG